MSPPQSIQAEQTEAPDPQSWVEGLPDEFIKCRTYRHAWDDHTAAWNGRQRRWRVVIQCQRCAMKRHMVRKDNGYIEASHYEVPRGYLAVGLGYSGSQRTAALWVEKMRRQAAAHTPKVRRLRAPAS